MSDIVNREIAQELLADSWVGAFPGGALSLAQDQSRATDDDDQNQQNNQLLAIHFAEVFLRLTTAITTPEAATAIGTARMLSHLSRFCIETTSLRKSFCTCLSRLRVSTSCLRRLASSCCCSGERIKR